MLDQMSLDALVKACQNKFQVTITYTKTSTGETVTHTGGIQEINGNILWLWDTMLNDTIRKFYISNILSLQVLEVLYSNSNGYPIKLNGQVLGF